MAFDFSVFDAPKPDAAPAAPPPPSDGADYTPIFKDAGTKNEVDPDLLRSVADIESGPKHNRWAISPVGAQGVMQLMPGTADSLGVDRPFDPEQNIHGGAKYLKEQLNTFNHDPYRALAAYNAGPHGNLDADGPQSYARDVLSRWDYYRQARAQRPSVASPAAAAPQPPAPAAPAPTTTPVQPPLVIGDSLAEGIGGKGEGRHQGNNPQDVLNYIKNSLPDNVGGRDVVLSSGASNDPSQAAKTLDQINELRARGAGNITLIGVGNRPDFTKAGVNTTLSTIAERTGARFLPLPADQLDPEGVHLTGTGYKALLAQAQQPSPKPAAGFDFSKLPGEAQPPAEKPAGFDFSKLPGEAAPAAKPTAPAATTETAQPPPHEAGWGETTKEAIKVPLLGTTQTLTGATTGKPGAVTPTPNIDAAQPIQLADLKNPALLGKKLWYGLVSSSPEIAGFAVGSGLAGGPETGWGLVTGGIGAAAAHSLTNFGPTWAAELEANPKDPDGAFERTWEKTGIGAVASAASFAGFQLAPFKSTLKNLVFQAFGLQPAISEAQKAGTNVVEGKPVTTGLGEDYPAEVIGTAAPIIAHAGATRIARGLAPAAAEPGTEPAATPATGPGTPEAEALRRLEAQGRGEQLPPTAPTVPAPPAEATREPPVTTREPPVVDYTPPEPPPTVPRAPDLGPRLPLPEVVPGNVPPFPEPRAEPVEVAPRSGDIVNLTPNQLTVDPKRFQYKASDEKGVTGALHGTERWEKDLADPITVWQDKDGTNYVVNGHQRTDLARRAEAAGQEDVQVPAKIFKETDGYTPEYMKMLGAYQNIAQGSGTALDAARILRSKDNIPADRQLPNLPPRQALVKSATALANLSDDAFGMVANGFVPEAHAAVVGDMIKDPAQQVAALSMLMRHDPATVNQARLMVKDILNAGFDTQTQGDIFGDQQVTTSLVPERARILDRAMTNLRGTRRIFKAAVEGEQTLTGQGNVLNPEANIAARTENERLLDTLDREASLRGPISDALTEHARELAAGKSIGSVAPRFLAAVRQIVRGGEDQGVRPGAPAGGAGDTGAAGEGDAGPQLELGAGRRPVPGQADIFGAPTPEARPPRQAEPTIRTDPRQQVMPGMGPSAVQQQAARDQAGRGALLPRAPQEPPGGLFAPRETEQPQLPETAAPSPAAQRFVSRGTDETAQIPAHTPETAHSTAANLVFDLGRDDGKEHLALVDLTTGQVVHASTDGRPNRVTVMLTDPDGLTPRSIVFHHNHPDSSPPSPTDLALAGSTPSVSHVVVEGEDGRVYTVSTTDQFERRVAGKSNPERGAVMDGLTADAREYARKTLQALVDARIISVDQANAAHLDVAHRFLHAGGWIDYVSGYPLPKAIVDALHQVFGRVGHSAADAAYLTRSVFADEAIASLPRGMGTPSGDAGRPIGGPPGRGGEARAGPAQGILLEARAPPNTPPAIAEAAEGLREETRKVSDSIATGLVPMRSGSTRAQAFASTFANGLRRVMFRYGTIDRAIRKEFNADARAKMGSALDRQSVFEQQIRDLPPDEQAARRAEFDAGGTGLAGLNPRERATVEALEQRSQQLWERYQRLSMVAPNAVRIPYYFSRQVVVHSEELGFSRPEGGGAGGNRGLDQRGSNLTTRGPMRREYLTPEETEAAAQARFGPEARVLTDIRSLVQRLADGERAAHGVELMNAIDQVGRETGVNLVVRGDIPGLLTPGDYFTIADHPAFRRWTGAGWQAVHVAREFEGPLKAVLRQESPAWYNAAMKLKGGVMNSIMFSPFIHLAVEVGRALPVLPGRMLTLQVFRDGSRLRNNADYMDRAIRDGLAPLGQGWHSDPVSIADQAKMEATQLGKAQSALEGVRAVGRFMHETLLWDNVFKLQVGIYDAMKSRMMAKGLDEPTAGTVAAHIANRYAGALPPEHLSKSANMAANLLLFSRSFTLGNLGVIKDMLTGAPKHVLARIEQLSGPEAAQSAKSAMQRKAISAFALDIGLFYMANGLLQTGLQVLRQAPQAGGLWPAAQQVYNQWLTDSENAIHDAKDNPLEIFGVLPQHWNEPGKQDRVYAGLDSQGRGIYLRLPPGKVGEEFLGWFSKPGVMLENKTSPLVRPILEAIVGHDTLGRALYPPNPQTVGDYMGIAGAIVQHIGAALLPMQTLQGAGELYQHYVQGKPSKGDPSVAAAKVLGPMTGLATVSSGFPGGPEAGEMYAWKQRQTAAQQAAMPGIRDKILSGDVDGARADMTRLGMPPREIGAIVNLMQRPGPSRAMTRAFQQGAPPEIQQRVQHDRALMGGP